MGPSPHERDGHASGGPLVTRRGALALLSSVLAGLGLWGVAPQLAQATPSASQETLDALDDAQARYDQAQQRLSEIGEELEDLGYQQAETQSQIDDLSSQISSKQADIEAKQAEIDARQADIEAKQADIEAKQAEIDARQAEIDREKEELSERVSADYKSGSVTLLSILLNSKTMEELLSNVHYMDRISQSQAEQIAEVRALKAQLEGERAALESQKEELESQKEELESQKTDLESQRASLESQRADLEALEAQLAEQVSAAEAKQQEASDLVDSLDQEVRDLMERKAQEEEAARQEEIRKAQEAAAAAAAGSYGAAGTPAIVGDDLRSSLVAAALSLLGTPYVWGGTWPTSGGTDCSGLMQWSFAQCGYSIPRTTYTQLPACRAAGHLFYDTSQLQPGDLVFCNRGRHVVMYIGNGNVVHDPHPGDVVRIAPLTDFQIVAMGFPIA